MISLKAFVIAHSALILLPATAAEPQPRPTDDEAALARALRSILPDGALAGVYAAWTDTGAPAASLGPDELLIPASTAKLATTSCALHTLGPAHRFRTVFASEAILDGSGRLAGDLYLVGGGDPQLRVEDLWAAVRNLVALGVREIDGDLVADSGLFDGPPRPESWPRSRRSDPYHAAQGALAVAWNSLEVVVTPGTRAGDPARAALFPVGAPVRLVSRVTTSPRGGRVSVSLEAGEGGTQLVTVDGAIAPGSDPVRRWFRIGPPALGALRALGELLHQNGIELKGTMREARLPDRARPLYVHESRPLASLVVDINKYSSNFGAEILLRHLDAPGRGRGATVAGGLQRLRDCLDQLGVATKALAPVDGSGYGRAARASARGLTELLLAASRHHEWGTELIASLPRAGEDGSLSRRLGGLSGRVRAKTGSLTGVRGLAGFAVTESGREIAFAILINAADPAQQVSDSVVDRSLMKLLRHVEQRTRPGDTNSTR